MSSGSGQGSKESHKSIEFLFQAEDDISSEDVPKEDWSSLILVNKETNIKKVQHSEGLYDPGSGEICAKYIALSASSVLRHAYYKYPAITDPGIEQALLGSAPVTTYRDDGQDLYLTLCKEMCIPPIRSFYRSLLSSKVDLSYYGVSTKAVRAISLALQYNRIVQVLDLTDNWMNTDACYHLGEVLRDNNTIGELILKGCRIGVEGARVLFHHLAFNRNIYKIDISGNQLGDKGIEFVTAGILKNPLIVDINLAHNEISATGIMSFVELLERKNKVTHLDLSWNNIITSNAIYKLCQLLRENNNFVELDLSWNSLSAPRVGTAIKFLLTDCKSIRKVILSNNKLTGMAVKYLGKGLPHAKNLETLDLSYNPIEPSDALFLLKCLQMPSVKLKRLILDNIVVEQEFVETCNRILALDFRKDTVVTHGYARPSLDIKLHDMKSLILKRAEAIGRSAKKKTKCVDFPMLILEMHAADPAPIVTNYFTAALKSRGLNLDDDLLEQMAKYFPGPLSTDKNKLKTINLEGIVDYIKRLWPNKKALPPIPPVPLPLPPPPKKGKGKKK